MLDATPTMQAKRLYTIILQSFQVTTLCFGIHIDVYFKKLFKLQTFGSNWTKVMQVWIFYTKTYENCAAILAESLWYCACVGARKLLTEKLLSICNGLLNLAQGIWLSDMLNCSFYYLLYCILYYICFFFFILAFFVVNFCAEYANFFPLLLKLLLLLLLLFCSICCCCVCCCCVRFALENAFKMRFFRT